MSLIRKLDDQTIKLIVAGEVYGKPTNILKELVDNALDAHATNVRLSIGDGGFKSISVADNGDGIYRDDKYNLCQRFCTSKIKQHADLQELSTFGFRGEALALLSHTSDLVITSRHKSEEVGWTGTYRDGALISSSDSARERGTTVTATNIFRRHQHRRQAGSEIGQERAAAAALITDLAVHFSDVAFSLIADEKDSLLATQTQADRSLESRKSQIKRLYGSRVANALLSVAKKSDVLQVEALMSPLQYENSSRMVANFTCFVNDRLVTWSALKRAIRLLYQESSPKDRLVFVYLDIHIPQSLIDPNVDPSKAMFVCKDEAEIVQWIADSLRTQQEKKHVPITSTIVERQATKRQSERITANDLFELLSSSSNVPCRILQSGEMIGSIVCGLFLVAVEDQLAIIDLRMVLAYFIDCEIATSEPLAAGTIHDYAQLSPPLQLHALADILPTNVTLQNEALAPILDESHNLIYVPYILEPPTILEIFEVIRRLGDHQLSLGALAVMISGQRRRSDAKQSNDERLWHYLMTKLSVEGVEWNMKTDHALEGFVKSVKCAEGRVIVSLQALLSAFERC